MNFWRKMQIQTGLLLSVFILNAVTQAKKESGYVLTTQKLWFSNNDAQICLALVNETFGSGDFLTASLYAVKSDVSILFQEFKLDFNKEGESTDCASLLVPKIEEKFLLLAKLKLVGTIGSRKIDEDAEVTVVDAKITTHVQTDKYLYRPGEKVHLRLLTLTGPLLNISYENYEEIYVESPVGNRLFQWLNVDNSKGLAHLSFDLSLEAVEGLYLIVVITKGSFIERRTFAVKAYESPRYNVSITPSGPIFIRDESIKLVLCARYPSGAPVKGNATVHLVYEKSWEAFVNFTQTKLISKGCEIFTFSNKDLSLEINGVWELITKAIVIEEETGVEVVDSKDKIKVEWHAVKFMDASQKNMALKPFVPFKIKVRASLLDGSILSNETMEVCSEYKTQKLCKNFTTCSRGFLSFLYSPSKFTSTIKVSAVNYPTISKDADADERLETFTIYRPDNVRYLDASNSSLTIYDVANWKCSSGPNITFALRVQYYVSNLTSTDVYVQVQYRGQVQYLNQVRVDFLQTELPFEDENIFLDLDPVPDGMVSGVFEIPVQLPPTVAPIINVLVWYTSDNNEVVADTRAISIYECSSDKLGPAWQESNVSDKPDQETILKLAGVNNSACANGLDKRTELMFYEDAAQTIGDIYAEFFRSTSTRLDFCLSKFDFASSSNDSSVTRAALKNAMPNVLLEEDVREALRIFDISGYHVMSNFVLEEKYCADTIKAIIAATKEEVKVNRYGYDTILGWLFKKPQPIAEDVDTLADSLILGYKEQMPEHWLWKITPESSQGELFETTKITEPLSDVCVKTVVNDASASSGSTFSSFVIDYALPATIKRGEILSLNVTAHNLIDKKMPVRLIVHPNSDFEFVSVNDVAENGFRNLLIPANEKSYQTLKIRFSVLGDVMVTVEAATYLDFTRLPTKTNKLERSIRVEPEGIVREKKWTKFVCSEDNVTASVYTWNLDVPVGGIVKGSDKAILAVSGNLVGPTLENIGHLLRIPRFDKKTNMLAFALNSHALQYLDASNQATSEIKRKVQTYLDISYQWLISDESGDFTSDNNNKSKNVVGSSWMNAFALKSLIQAKSYVFIDELVLTHIIGSLKENQNKSSGCFEDRESFNNQKIQGGIPSSGHPEILLSAFVLTAILEAESIPDSIESAIICIESDTSTQLFSLALRAYSLSLAKSPKAQSIIDQLLEVAVRTSSFMKGTFEKNAEIENFEEETAGYALLALLHHNPEKYSESTEKIFTWLTYLRNKKHGFSSTQKTVVVLQALAAYKKTQPGGPWNLTVKSNDDRTPVIFSVNQENKLLHQQKELVDVPSSVSLNISGVGCTVIQGLLRYNLFVESPNSVFTLKLNTNGTSIVKGKFRNLHACTSYTLSDGASNMAILEFKLVSGYIPVKDDLKKVVGDGSGVFKRYEVEDSKVIFYLDEVTKDEVCARFNVEQIEDIENSEPGTVTVYDYRQPEYKTLLKYIPVVNAKEQ